MANTTIEADGHTAVFKIDLNDLLWEDFEALLDRGWPAYSPLIESVDGKPPGKVNWRIIRTIGNEATKVVLGEDGTASDTT